VPFDHAAIRRQRPSDLICRTTRCLAFRVARQRPTVYTTGYDAAFVMPQAEWGCLCIRVGLGSRSSLM
jgi:hypothetical protein